MNSVAVVILAAGAATRFGSAKQLAEIGGKSMLQRVLDNCSDRQEADLFLVLGANQEAIRTKIQIDEPQVICNPNWQEGIGSSIRTATAKLKNEYEGILFVAGDQPLVNSQKLGLLLDKWRESPELICAAKYQNTLGIPAIFPRNSYSKLSALSGDRGAKQVLLENKNDIQSVEIAEAATDIDRPEDLNRFNAIE
ncbi:MAG: nucleotidyltransferase family protein [Porticoccaceae bacterium]|jgi:molybdenum cofactor cytidylyltransferase|nr:nucleotidyltransferase family protein [Porticoccaceae bacterium]